MRWRPIIAAPEHCWVDVLFSNGVTHSALRVGNDWHDVDLNTIVFPRPLQWQPLPTPPTGGRDG